MKHELGGRVSAPETEGAADVAASSVPDAGRSPLATLVEAAKPFARIASWRGLTDQNSDNLPVQVRVEFPSGFVVCHLKAKELRLISEALELATPNLSLADSQRKDTRQTLPPGCVAVCEFAMPNRHGGQQCNNEALAGWDCKRTFCPINPVNHSMDGSS